MKSNIEYLALINKGFSGFIIEQTRDENLFPKKFGTKANNKKKPSK